MIAVQFAIGVFLLHRLATVSTIAARTRTLRLRYNGLVHQHSPCRRKGREVAQRAELGAKQAHNAKRTDQCESDAALCSNRLLLCVSVGRGKVLAGSQSQRKSRSTSLGWLVATRVNVRRNSALARLLLVMRSRAYRVHRADSSTELGSRFHQTRDWICPVSGGLEILAVAHPSCAPREDVTPRHPA